MPSANATLVDGDISIEYDKDLRNIFLGGQGESLQFREADITKGLTEGGYYVGIEFAAADKLDNLETGIMEFNGKRQEGGEFFSEVGGQRQAKFVIYPRFSEKDRTATLKLTWQDGSQEQVYKIILREGTILENTR